jgi:short-subunit dehydrogenase
MSSRRRFRDDGQADAEGLRPIAEQVIVITGASSGIGLATALVAAECGAKVVVNARSADTLAALVEYLAQEGAEAVAVPGDVGDRALVERIAQTAIERFGRIDTWVNNAGVSIYGRLPDVSDEDNRRLFDTNFWGVVYGSLAALPHLKKTGGSLVNVGSEVSEAVVPLQGMYSASKHAVKGFTDALRIELVHDEVPVSITLVQPGATDTPFPQHARNYMDQEPALPTPLDNPFHVAEAILEAATSDKRSIKVSSTAKMNTAMAKLLPAIGDRIAAKQMDRQQYDEPPRDPEGALHETKRTGRTYGTGGVRDKSPA